MSKDTRKEFIPAGSDLEKEVDAFLAKYKNHPEREHARELAAVVLKMLKEDVTAEEWNLSKVAMKEMRHSYRVFAPYRDKRKVTVFGSARSKPESPEYKAALDFSSKMKEKGWMVLTGAGPGIMQAANQGAGRENSFGLNIAIPWEQFANEYIDGDRKLINFHYFFTRKLSFLKESHGLVLFPGGYGTQDEAFETLVLIQTGKSPLKPIVMVDHPSLNYWTKWLRFMQTSQLKNGYINTEDLYLWKITYDVNEAVDIVTRFYHRYHSHRWVGDRLVMRLQSKLDDSFIDELNNDFSDIIEDGSISQTEAIEEEADPDGNIPFKDLPRLIFVCDKRGFGRLRLLIDRINMRG